MLIIIIITTVLRTLTRKLSKIVEVTMQENQLKITDYFNEISL